jgi:hypothetical protein
MVFWERRSAARREDGARLRPLDQLNGAALRDRRRHGAEYRDFDLQGAALVDCQSARKFDPLSASKIDPSGGIRFQ